MRGDGAHPKPSQYYRGGTGGDSIPDEGEVIVATGPLTSDAMANYLQAFFGEHETLHFYDAAAPLVSFESVDMNHAFFASRYDRGTPDYINCPLSEEEYHAFVQALVSAEEAEVHGFEDKHVFEGCMPWRSWPAAACRRWLTAAETPGSD